MTGPRRARNDQLDAWDVGALDDGHVNLIVYGARVVLYTGDQKTFIDDMFARRTVGNPVELNHGQARDLAQLILAQVGTSENPVDVTVTAGLGIRQAVQRLLAALDYQEQFPELAEGNHALDSAWDHVEALDAELARLRALHP